MYVMKGLNIFNKWPSLFCLTNQNLVFQNQEAFIRMINETEGDEGGLGEEGEGALGALGEQQGVIQVSPQDKEAIDRVSAGWFSDDFYYFANPPSSGLRFHWSLDF